MWSCGGSGLIRSLPAFRRDWHASGDMAVIRGIKKPRYYDSGRFGVCLKSLDAVHSLCDLEIFVWLKGKKFGLLILNLGRCLLKVPRYSQSILFVSRILLLC
jgi:hypothetical protein